MNPIKLHRKLCIRCHNEYNPTTGSQRFCKLCSPINRKLQQSIYAHTSQGIASRKKYDRTEKAKVKYKKYRSKPEYRLYSKNRIKSGSDRYKAQYYLSNAVRDKRLIRPNNCSECKVNDWGDKRSVIEGHHYKGYNPENWLEIQWLCTNCHKLAHKGGGLYSGH